MLLLIGEHDVWKRRNSGSRIGNWIQDESVICTRNTPDLCREEIASKNVDQERVDLGYLNGLK